jgi:Mg2+ and Co2+ transporter CorA
MIAAALALLAASAALPTSLPVDAATLAKLPAASATLTAHGQTHACTGVWLTDLAVASVQSSLHFLLQHWYKGRLVQQEIDSPDTLAHAQPVWVDLEDPSPMEKGWISARFGLHLPDNIVDDDLEESARFYEEDNGELHIRSDFLIDDDVTPRNVRVAFILKDGVLFSVHGEDLPVFRLLRLRARRIPALIGDAKDVLLKLYDADAEYSADALEGIYDSLEKVSARVLKQDVDDRAIEQRMHGWNQLSQLPCGHHLVAKLATS